MTIIAVLLIALAVLVVSSIGSVNMSTSTNNPASDQTTGQSTGENPATSTLASFITLPDQVNTLIEKWAAYYNVDPNLMKAQAWYESRGNQWHKDGTLVISSAGAIGVFQLEPATAKGLGVDPSQIDSNIQGGVKFMRQLLDQYNGSVVLALAAYNAGAGNVQKYGGVPPFAETEAYVNNIVSAIQGVS